MKMEYSFNYCSSPISIKQGEVKIEESLSNDPKKSQ